MKFEDLIGKEKIYLYAGHIPSNRPSLTKIPFIGLCPSLNDKTHIPHDVTQRHDLPDGIVDIYQSEDVFEHIEYSKLVNTINDIYRILKPGGLFRLSVPDYRCDVLVQRSSKDAAENIYYDPGGGGSYQNGRVVDGGHVWFPKYETVKSLLEQTHFKNITFFHYYDPSGRSICRKIDYSKGYIQRTPDHDRRVQKPARVMSIVVDCIKD